MRVMLSTGKEGQVMVPGPWRGDFWMQQEPTFRGSWRQYVEDPRGFAWQEGWGCAGLALSLDGAFLPPSPAPVAAER